MLKIFAPGKIPLVKEVILPHLKPFFAASLKLGIMLGLKASVIAEYFGANDGIGFQIQVAYQSLQVRRLFGWGLIFVMLILIFDAALSRIERQSHLRSWQRAKTIVSAHQRRNEFEELQRVFLAPRPCPPITIENVAFSYCKQQSIVEGINLTVQAHEIVVISGDSGKGKTTLLNLIAGLLTPTSGRTAPPEQLGFIFQDDRFLPWRNNTWNVALPLIYQGYSIPSAISFARYLLDEVGLHGEEIKYPEELSGGMKKRLAFARCFARLPGAILMDEPFTGLHKEAREALWEKFFALLRLHPVPVIIVTHFPEEIECTEHCRFYEVSGSPATLLAQV
jgi:ABC-type nitrate/sulfonate/bicarbonate transport system ATPase subunit